MRRSVFLKYLDRQLPKRLDGLLSCVLFYVKGGMFNGKQYVLVYVLHYSMDEDAQLHIEHNGSTIELKYGMVENGALLSGLTSLPIGWLGDSVLFPTIDISNDITPTMYHLRFSFLHHTSGEPIRIELGHSKSGYVYGKASFYEGCPVLRISNITVEEYSKAGGFHVTGCVGTDFITTPVYVNEETKAYLKRKIYMLGVGGLVGQSLTKPVSYMMGLLQSQTKL